MKYAAVIEYIQDKAKIEEHRPAHRRYLTEILQNGQLFCTGPFTDDYGALIIYEADSAEQAEGFLKGDPFYAAGVFVRWTVRPWKIVFANPKLLPTV